MAASGLDAVYDLLSLRCNGRSRIGLLCVHPIDLPGDFSHPINEDPLQPVEISLWRMQAGTPPVPCHLPCSPESKAIRLADRYSVNHRVLNEL